MMSDGVERQKQPRQREPNSGEAAYDFESLAQNRLAARSLSAFRISPLSIRFMADAASAAIPHRSSLLSRPRFGLRQPTPPQLLGRDAGQVGFDIQNRCSVEHVYAADVQKPAFAAEKLNHG